MKKLLFFDIQGQICAVAVIEDALAVTHHARDPRWSKIEIAHEDERVIAAGGGHARHFVAAIDDATTTAKPLFVGQSLDGENDFGIHRKDIVKLRVAGDDSISDCACGADAHASVADVHSEIEASTLTISWDCREPVKLWIDTEPVAGPRGGMCHESVQFTPPYSGRVKIWGKHPRYFIEPVIVHALEPAIAESESTDA
jgi:hypothetical protein